MFMIGDIERALKFLESSRFQELSELCRLMNKYGSDKGDTAPWGKGHRYAPFYDALFSRVRAKPLNLFELGVGTTNLEVKSNMTASGTEGASLFAWRDYFPNAQIIGADIDKACLFSGSRIKTYYCDQLKPITIRNMLEEFGDDLMFDIILEDGLHTFEASFCLFFHINSKLKKGGLFIIEDIAEHTLNKYQNILELMKVSFSLSYAKIIRIPDLFQNNNNDNNLLVILK